MAAVLSLLPALAAAGIDVVTHRNDNGRSGQNLSETILTTSNVTVNTFGKLFTRSVDGQIYAQPLYLSDLAIQGTRHNVVFVATMHNSVYAFDADNPNASAPLWQVNLGTPVPAQDISSNYHDISPEIGILSTPVIDTSTGTIHVVAKTKRLSDSTYHFQLHALDVASGAEKLGGPVEITAQVPGNGDGSTGGQVILDPLHHLNRPALLLQNGVLYLAFGSLGDIFPYHGWVLAYNTTPTLQRAAVFNVTPNGSEGAVWQAGTGLMGDGSAIYLTTGNGTFDANTSGTEFGDSALKLSSSLAVLDYFTPYNQGSLNNGDVDLGGGGLTMIPGTKFAVFMGKDGVFRVIDTTNLGKFNNSFNADVQEFQGYTGGYEFMGAPIYWNSPNNGPVVYLWGPNDKLKAFKYTGGTPPFQATPVSSSSVTSAPGYSNAVPLSLTANGSQAGTGIVWAAAPYSQDANQQTVSGIVRAFDATNLSVELWNSRQNQARDDVGNYAKFCPPTIVNGKVYVATFSNQLAVYGLFPLSITTTALSSGTLGVSYSQPVSATGGQPPYTWSVSSGSLPPGLTLNTSTGTISGTPTAVGTSGFTVLVQDAALNTATQGLSISILSASQTIAIDATASRDSSANGSTITSATLTTKGPNELLLAFIAADAQTTGSNTTVTGVTNTGGALTWTRAIVTNRQLGTAEIWWAYATSTFTGTVTATMNRAVPARSITVVSFTGTARGADAIGATGSGNGSTGAPTASLTTTRANSWVVASGNDWDAAIARTPASGQTIVRQYLSGTGDTFWVQRLIGAVAAGTVVTIQDTAPSTDRYNLSALEIRTPPVSGPLTITTASLPSGTVGVSYPSQTMTASGGAPPYSWTATSLPPGLSMTSAGVIGGTPTAAGTYSVGFMVVDSVAGSATTSLNLTITPPTLVSITVTPANPTILVNGTQQFTATGNYSDGSTQSLTASATWSSSNGAVASVSASGLATGLAQGSATIAATYGAIHGSTLLNVQALTPVAVTTQSLPSGLINLSYQATLTASGGTAPYSWSITLGTLPPGLSLNASTGVISGTPTSSGTFNFTVQVTDSSNPSQSTTKALSIVIAPQTSIWPSNPTPKVPDDGPDSAVEIGVKFRSDVAGVVTGIRFYKSTNNTGTHVGHLWSSNGALLATVTFTGETASGWQQANFAAPVAIQANTTYIASYHTNVGHYADDQNYFATTGVDNAPLHAPANGVSGFNGVYAYGTTSIFPTNGWNSSNYWVDIVFHP